MFRLPWVKGKNGVLPEGLAQCEVQVPRGIFSAGEIQYADDCLQRSLLSHSKTCRSGCAGSPRRTRHLIQIKGY